MITYQDADDVVQDRLLDILHFALREGFATVHADGLSWGPYTFQEQAGGWFQVYDDDFGAEIPLGPVVEPKAQELARQCQQYRRAVNPPLSQAS
jgi:hypothetical protein